MVKISVIIPCYNQEDYIAECLESVLNQTYTDYEIIVINDGSKDKSLSVIEQYAQKYPNKISVIDQENQGVIVARNNGIKQSKGIYIYPLDGDDKIAPTCLEKLYQSMEANKGDVIYSRVNYFGNKTEEFKTFPATNYRMYRSNRVVVSALFRKSDWEKYGGYDECMKNGLEDWEFWLNFCEDNKKFYKVDEILFFYRITENSRNAIPREKQKELFNYIKKKHYKFHRKQYIPGILHKIFLFFFQRKITKSGVLSIKICKIPVFRRRIK